MLADLFFKERYSHRAVVLETIAGVPGMVGGMWRFVCSVNRGKNDPVIMELLGEADNERMHLMTFIEVAKPSLLERFLILVSQVIFWVFYFILYVFFRKTAHRMIGYFEEEAVKSYTEYLKMIDSGMADNPPAPNIAKDYWALPDNAKLRDVVEAIREDEMGHAKTNHELA
jgi:ubiquinol oxidase